MKRSATALGILLIASSPGLAEDPFQPTASERATIDKCLKRTAEDGVLKQAAARVGLISDPCIEKDTATPSPARSTRRARAGQCASGPA